MQALDGFLFVVNTEGRVEYVTDNITDYIKYTKNDVLGKDIYNIIHHGDHNNFMPNILPMSVGKHNCHIFFFKIYKRQKGGTNCSVRQSRLGGRNEIIIMVPFRKFRQLLTPVYLFGTFSITDERKFVYAIRTLCTLRILQTCNEIPV